MILVFQRRSFLICRKICQACVVLWPLSSSTSSAYLYCKLSWAEIVLMLCCFTAQLVLKCVSPVLWLLENKNNFYLFLTGFIPTVIQGKKKIKVSYKKTEHCLKKWQHGNSTENLRDEAHFSLSLNLLVFALPFSAMSPSTLPQSYQDPISASEPRLKQPFSCTEPHDVHLHGHLHQQR